MVGDLLVNFGIFQIKSFFFFSLVYFLERSKAQPGGVSVGTK